MLVLQSFIESLVVVAVFIERERLWLSGRTLALHAEGFSVSGITD